MHLKQFCFHSLIHLFLLEDVFVCVRACVRTCMSAFEHVYSLEDSEWELIPSIMYVLGISLRSSDLEASTF